MRYFFWLILPIWCLCGLSIVVEWLEYLYASAKGWLQKLYASVKVHGMRSRTMGGDFYADVYEAQEKVSRGLLFFIFSLAVWGKLGSGHGFSLLLDGLAGATWVISGWYIYWLFFKEKEWKPQKRGFPYECGKTWASIIPPFGVFAYWIVFAVAVAEFGAHVASGFRYWIGLPSIVIWMILPVVFMYFRSSIWWLTLVPAVMFTIKGIWSYVGHEEWYIFVVCVGYGVLFAVVSLIMKGRQAKKPEVILEYQVWSG